MKRVVRVLLVEDNEDQRKLLEYHLNSFKDVKVIAHTDRGEKAIELTNQLFPDVTILDIDLPDMNGVEIARKIIQNDFAPLIVFYTSYPQYAVEGFEVDALDYLVKPINPERLKKTIQKIRTRLAQSLTPELEDERSKQIQYLTVQINGHFFVIHVDDIIYFTIESGTVLVHLKNNVGKVKYRSLKQLEAELDPRKFIRVHRKYLINIDKIDEIVVWFKNSYRVVMKQARNANIELSRRGMKKLRKVVKW